MRSKRNRRPRWGMLNLILLATIGSLALEHFLRLTPGGHKLALLLIIVVIYGLMGWWVKSNANALQAPEDIEHQSRAHDPAVYGTSRFPTPTQAHFRSVLSLYRHESPPKR